MGIMKIINTILLGAIIIMLIIIQSTLTGMSDRMETSAVTKIERHYHGDNFIDIMSNGSLTIPEILEKINDGS